MGVAVNRQAGRYVVDVSDSPGEMRVLEYVMTTPVHRTAPPMTAVTKMSKVPRAADPRRRCRRAE